MIDAAQIDRWRSDTPGSSKRIHLNNAGASLVPDVVHQAVVEHLELERDAGGYEAAAIRHDEIQDTYEVLAQLVGARPANIGIVANATAGLLYEIFGAEMTASPTECAHCGREGEVGALLAFTQGPGIVLRCSGC